MKAADFGIDGHNFGQILARFAHFAEGFVVTDNSHTLKSESGFLNKYASPRHTNVTSTRHLVNASLREKWQWVLKRHLA